MTLSPLSIASLRRAMAQGWRIAGATRAVGLAYALLFTVGGLAIIGGLLAQGWTPFVIAAAGAFMLVGPAILAGFFGIARAHECFEPLSDQYNPRQRHRPLDQRPPFYSLNPNQHENGCS